jgi:hypothetical protein
MNSGDLWTNSALPPAGGRTTPRGPELRKHGRGGPPSEREEKVRRRHFFFRYSMTSVLGGMDRELLDHRVREQLRRELGHALRCDRLGEVNLEPLALANALDLAKAEAPAGTGDCLALRVVDLRLQHHVDDESGHIPNSTRARSPKTGRDRGRLAVDLKLATVTRFVTCVTIGTL